MFAILEQSDIQEIHFRRDADSGLKAIIAIHSTKLGPALGGCRFLTYDDDNKAIHDAIRLARGMSYKAVLAGVKQGGGKSVIIKPANYDPEKLFTRFGQFVESLNGRYITAIDSGTSAFEMDIIANQTRHVTSTSREKNPSQFTAQGVFEGIQAAVNHQLHTERLEGIRVALQGLGNVGFALANLLHEAGANLIVSDINPTRVKQACESFQAEQVQANAIYDVECDVFAPCGLGGIINPDTLSRLQCSIVAGSANNQLATAQEGRELHQAGILYAPDYVINAGGLIYASMHHASEPDEHIHTKTAEISQTLSEIFEHSKTQNKATSEIADELAEAKLSAISA
ncbi:MAG: amino acid dehydrogenase [Pseudomonadales bacterium]|nr:amino acid dehydrogenase [Pseudomonadales bacterium]